MHRLSMMSLVLLLCLCMPSWALAELYLGAFGGHTFPNDYSDQKTTLGGVTSYPADSPNGSSYVVGGKVGYFFERARWLGLETEAFYTKADIGKPGGPVAPGDVRVITVAENVMVRYPGNRIQPYVGVGLGVLFVDVRQDFPGHPASAGDASDVALGLNALGGLRVFLTDSIGLFAEYKYQYSPQNFEIKNFLGTGDTLENEGVYSTNMVVGGLAYHF